MGGLPLSYSIYPFNSASLRSTLELWELEGDLAHVLPDRKTVREKVGGAQGVTPVESSGAR